MSMKEITKNLKSRLFVIPAGQGFTCLGFETCFQRANQLASKLGEPLLDEKDIGKIEQFMAYQELIDKARGADLGTWFEPGTPDGVQSALERARESGARIRVFYGDSQTGQDWLEEHDVMGTVGRTTGPLKTPILLANARSSGGGAILTKNVVRVIELSPRTGKHIETYRHPGYHQPKLWIRRGIGDQPSWMVYANGRPHAGFGSKVKAQAFAAFLRGIRFSK